MTKPKHLLPPPLPEAVTRTLESPVVIARKIVAGEAFTDQDAVRVADAYLFLIDDGGTHDEVGTR